ncbi:hypothetical protein B0H14DRAFT_2578612 [Mycena olivaceomarginata]|nr:hypothetical protein B0H14DRAFT_2578612 [Mycena olivaceomarginata]
MTPRFGYSQNDHKAVEERRESDLKTVKDESECSQTHHLDPDARHSLDLGSECRAIFLKYKFVFAMVNPTGSNGTDNGVFPPDEDLKEILHDFQRRSLSLGLRLRYLKEHNGIKIGLTKLKELNQKFSVLSARKFKAVEEATAAIAEIIARDVNQGQGPDTVKKIASLRLNLTIPRDFVRDTMKGLVSQAPSDMRCPGRRKGPKKRSALDAIGIFQEIHVDGHEKLGEKALRMGPGIGIDIYGMRDHVGKILWLVVIPNSRLSDTIGHVFLDMVSKYKVTFDGGSELGWLASFQTTLRNLFHWLWPKIVQIGLDEFMDYFNNKKTRKQSTRILPSGVSPNVVFDMPEDYGLQFPINISPLLFPSLPPLPVLSRQILTHVLSFQGLAALKRHQVVPPPTDINKFIGDAARKNGNLMEGYRNMCFCVLNLSFADERIGSIYGPGRQGEGGGGGGRDLSTVPAGHEEAAGNEEDVGGDEDGGVTAIRLLVVDRLW